VKIPELRWPAREEEYDDDLLLDIEVGVIAFLYRGRNAWHSTWVQNWFREARLYRDIYGARFGAESLRKQGSVFYVREVPALLLRGSRESVVVCDINASAPFSEFDGVGCVPVDTAEGRWIDGIYPGVSLRDATRAFDPASGKWRGAQKAEGSVALGLVSADSSLPSREEELRSVKSYPQGTGYLLGWTTDHARRPLTMEGADAVRDSWQQLADMAARISTEDHDRRSAFIHYRDHVLEAQPHSLWLAARETRRAAAVTRWHELSASWLAARARVADLKTELQAAQAELSAAVDAQFRTADTSAGVRAQRVRVEAARTTVAELETKLVAAKNDERAAFAAQSAGPSHFET